MKIKIIISYLLVGGFIWVFNLQSLYRYKTPLLVGERIEYEEIVNNGLDRESMINNKINDDLYQYYYGKNFINKEKLVEDMDFLFEKLEGTYGAYVGLGGKEKFDIAKENIVNKFEGRIQVDALVRMLRNEFQFLEDGHFLINNKNLKDFVTTYTVEEINIDKKGKAYYIDGLKMINWEELDHLIKPSIDENGNIIYRFFYKNKGNTRLVKEAYLEGGKKIDLIWTPVANIDLGNDQLPEYKIINGVPVLGLKKFYNGNNSNYGFTVDRIGDMSKYKNSILDLRGNGGGNAILVSSIVYSYAKKPSSYSSDILYNMNLEKVENNDRKALEGYLRYMVKAKKYNDTHYISRGNKIMRPKKEGIIILADGKSASASEHMIDTMRHFNKTLFIGIPTTGLMNSSSYYEIVLPNSKIKFNYGDIYMNFNEEYFKEYYGLEPDLWIEPKYALERSLKLIDNLNR